MFILFHFSLLIYGNIKLSLTLNDSLEIYRDVVICFFFFFHKRG